MYNKQVQIEFNEYVKEQACALVEDLGKNDALVIEKTDVFSNLKQAFENAVSFAVKNGLPKGSETLRSELFLAVKSEALRRLEQPQHAYREDVVANLDTGRKKYQHK